MKLTCILLVSNQQNMAGDWNVSRELLFIVTLKLKKPLSIIRIVKRVPLK